jgi:hypothetical protein
MKKLLLTRGDDFGSFVEANLAIRDCHLHGILRNASIMVPPMATPRPWPGCCRISAWGCT